MCDDSPELDYYRTVEDLFSTLRGVPHVLSPRDFQLLRSWWRDEVPLAAVSAGLTEVFTRALERDDDPVVSLSYCRHAVKRHAKRLAEMQVGRADGGEPQIDAEQSARKVAAALAEAARRLRGERPAVADVVDRIADQVELAGKELPMELVDEHLYRLESAMLRDCLRALADEERRTLDERIDDTLADKSVSDEVRERRARAFRDREVRLLLKLPRLEIGG